jgi:anti-sigma28 factor (negative regulator of flagellin synthesis)
MRISDRYERFTDRLSSSKAGATTGSDKSGAGKAASPTAATPAQPGVLSVKVSDRALQLAAGSTRLDELKEQIRNGTFKVDARAIANKLVGEDD